MKISGTKKENSKRKPQKKGTTGKNICFWKIYKEKWLRCSNENATVKK